MTPASRLKLRPMLSLAVAAVAGLGLLAGPVLRNAVAQGATAPAAPAASEANEAGPAKVIIGAFINDIQELDFKTNSYIADLNVWFRWTGKSLDPVKSIEFMNIFDPESQQKTVLYDAPKDMPDGSLYNIIRYHGRFSKKFNLEKYPFDRQKLDFVIEDSVSAASDQLFVTDAPALSINPRLSLPGYRFAAPEIDISPYDYPTNFGDLSSKGAESYSRVVLSVPILRPMFTLMLKTYVPILLIIVCAALVFFVHPRYVEGRIGLAITALLTLVAIQFTAAASMPDADYFTMLDKIYLLSYAFIIASLVRVVVTSWHGLEAADDPRAAEVSAGDQRWGRGLLIAYFIAATLISAWVLLR